MRVATWNVEWADPDTPRGSRARAVLESINAAVIVLTEGCRELLPPGNAIDGGTDWGYVLPDARRRKVILWSSFPITQVDVSVSPEIPPGRLVAGRIEHPRTPINMVAVCVPWRDAHVRTGRRDRTPWEDHLDFIRGLENFVSALEAPFVIAGDFNQRIPAGNQPKNVVAALSVAIENLQVATAIPLERPLIDHIVLSQGLKSAAVEIIPDSDEFGRISDHRGAVVEVALK
jgi:endonuclease/exonuclease/phosphatase family metal-dependent hydrolase